MSFSDDYKDGLAGKSGYGVDTFSYSYQMGQKDRERGSGGDAGAAGGGGILFGALAIIIAVCAFTIALISYPFAAGVAGAGFVIGVTMMQAGGSAWNGLGFVFALMVPIFIVYVFAFQLELKFGHNQRYRFCRQWWRILAGTYLVYFLGYALLTNDPEQAGFLEYTIHIFAVVVAPYLMYENSMRLDRKYELEPIRFRWLERLVAPVKNRLIPPVDEKVRETPVFHVKDVYKKAPMDVQVANGIVQFGETKVPVANVKTISYEREYRGWLLSAGVILPILLIVFIGKSSGEDFTGFFPQLFSVAGMAGGLALVLWAFIQKTPPGRIQGPFRHMNFYFAKDEQTNGQVYIKFARPEEERKFVQSIENSLKAMPKPEVPLTPSPAVPTEGGRLKQLRRAFKF